jgi:hypothetical protein
MSTRLIDYDPVTRTKTLYHDLGGDEYAVQTVQDVQSILDVTQAHYNSHSHKSAQKYKGDGLHYVGEVPNTVLDEIIRTCAGDNAAVAKACLLWLDQNPKAKTRPGSLTK